MDIVKECPKTKIMKINFINILHILYCALISILNNLFV